MYQEKNPHSLDVLFNNNREWVESVTASDPDFFKRLANQQSPEYMWIGCSDSRVPANQITGLAPGEVFVHRNIANVVVHTDLNALSVIQFAIDVLKVKHIIVVGHYGCVGVRAAMENFRVGLADNWIRHVKDVNEKHHSYLGSLVNRTERLDRLCELNVVEQVINVCQTTTMQDAWDRADIALLRSMMTDTMVAEIRSQLAEREAQFPGQANKTEVVMLEAQLLGIEDLADAYMASVEFNGMIREEPSAGPSPFREVWNMTKPKNGGSGWLVAGVQALQ